MRDAQKIIGIISERGKHQKPLRRLTANYTIPRYPGSLQKYLC